MNEYLEDNGNVIERGEGLVVCEGDGDEFPSKSVNNNGRIDN